jgi:hypothetical protein
MQFEKLTDWELFQSLASELIIFKYLNSLF